MTTRFTILTLALAMWGHADTLRLRDGSTVIGSYLGGTASDIRFLVNDQVQHYASTGVAEIIFGSIDEPFPRPETSGVDTGSVGKGPVDKGPDIVGAPFLRGSSGYIPLEREIATTSRGGGIYGLGGGSVYRVPGPRSSVRVRQADRIVFVVRLNPGDDPRQFQLYRLESRMGSRQTPPAMGGTPPGLPVTINKVGDSVYEITPARALYPGEYAVSPMNSNESYCFGVDY